MGHSPVITAHHRTPQPRSRLFRKYLIASVTFVTVVLVVSSATELYFSFQESQLALVRLQRAKASGAARDIEQFVKNIEQQIEWATPSAPSGVDDDIDQRREGYYRLLRQARAVADIRYIDTRGREQLTASRLQLERVGSGIDYSVAPEFTEPTLATPYVSPVSFQTVNSEPFVKIAVSEERREGGVTIAEVNLKFLWEVVSSAAADRGGTAYVVDERGRLIAHPNMSLVLRRSDWSALDHVRSALAGSAGPGDGFVAHDAEGNSVITAHERISRTGWFVFVEQPLVEVISPLYSLVARSLLLLAASLIVSALGSYVLARRMAIPLNALQDAAHQIASGALDQRIQIHTGDELEGLAEGFNRMAAELQALYAGLEQKVQERTSELAAALEELQDKTNELEQVSRHKSEFVAHMSHELRTPLNSILGFSQVMAMGMAGDLTEKQLEYLQDIRAAGGHLLDLINDILDLAKVEAGRIDLEYSLFFLPETLENTVAMFRETATSRQIHLELNVATSVAVISADERRVRQVVINLLSNAMKFTGQGGTVRTEAMVDDGMVIVSVEDTGTGVPPDEQGAIFEAFHQVRGNAGSSGGTGLGLTLSRQLIELHGGAIWVKSTPGKGSRFSFSLPTSMQSDTAPEAIIEHEYPPAHSRS